MLESKLNTQLHLRFAKSEDIPILVRHHCLMFEEILTLKGMDIDNSAFRKIETAHNDKLEKQLSDGSCVAWLIEYNKDIVASGAVSIISMVPVPDDPSHEVAYLHSMYTEKDFRRKKLAHRIIDEAILYCKGKGIKRMILAASDAGRPLYKQVGFLPAENLMRLWIK
jgi:GNAT superfamily N-acetyltransferase